MLKMKSLTEHSPQIINRAEWTDMARAEYVSQKALATVIPENVIEPVAWGVLEEDQSRSFYLTKFRSMRQEVPSLPHFIDIIRRLHQNSTSPTGKFGFHCTTYCGPPAMRNDWTDSWEEFWGRQFQSDVDYAQQVYGQDEELAELTTEFIQKVVARLLRPLQTGGRVLKPSLCHGDLWDGNVQIDTATNQVILFDSCAFYGHGESTYAPAFVILSAFMADNVFASHDTSGSTVDWRATLRIANGCSTLV